MNIISLIIDILLTIPLSLIMVKIEKKKDSFLYSCIIPVIYIIIIAAILPVLKKNIYLIPIFEIFIRNFYITNINEELNNSKNTILSSLISIILVLFIYNYFIAKVESVLPTPEEIRPFIWLIIVFVIYSISKDTNVKKISNNKSLEGKNEYILMHYAKYKFRYEEIIHSKNDTINQLIYSLIIYKNYQQPRIYRSINNYLRHLLNKEVKYGVLEVSSPTPISDEESIVKTIKEFENLTRKNKNKDNIEQFLSKYKEEEIKEIVNIYNVINNFKK